MVFWTIETDYEKEKEREVDFEVSDSWFTDYFNKNIRGTETRGNIDKDMYEFPEDFIDDYVLEDTLDIFENAKREKAIVKIIPLEEWVDIY